MPFEQDQKSEVSGIADEEILTALYDEGLPPEEPADYMALHSGPPGRPSRARRRRRPGPRVRRPGRPGPDSRADDGHAGGDQAGPGQDRGDAEQHVAEVPVARPDHLGRGDDEPTDDRAGQPHPGDAAVATGVRECQGAAAVVEVRHPPEIPGMLQAVEGSQPAAEDRSKGKKISLLATSNV